MLNAFRHHRNSHILQVAAPPCSVLRYRWVVTVRTPLDCVSDIALVLQRLDDVRHRGLAVVFDSRLVDAVTLQGWRAALGDFARGLTCPTPLFSATGPIYAAAMANGHGGDDTASVCAVLEAMAGIRRQ